MNNRLSVKFESGLYEITYRFRESNEISSLQDARELVDEAFLASVEKQLQDMHRTAVSAFGRRSGGEKEDEFDEIL